MFIGTVKTFLMYTYTGENITHKMQITYLMIKNLLSNLEVLPSIQKKIIIQKN